MGQKASSDIHIRHPGRLAFVSAWMVNGDEVGIFMSCCRMNKFQWQRRECEQFCSSFGIKCHLDKMVPRIKYDHNFVLSCWAHGHPTANNNNTHRREQSLKHSAIWLIASFRRRFSTNDLSKGQEEKKKEKAGHEDTHEGNNVSHHLVVQIPQIIELAIQLLSWFILIFQFK